MPRWSFGGIQEHPWSRYGGGK